MSEYTMITISFSIEEIVKLLSCCNQAIINIEDIRHNDHAVFTRQMTNGITLEKSLDKIWEIKTKLKTATTSSLGQSTKNGITVTMDITEWIKLNGCCNAGIEMEEKTLSFVPSDSNCTTICLESIQKIKDIKNKIKINLNQVYGDKFNI